MKTLALVLVAITLATTSGCVTIASDVNLLSEHPALNVTECALITSEGTLVLRGFAGYEHVERRIVAERKGKWVVLDGSAGPPPRGATILVVPVRIGLLPGSLARHVSPEGKIDAEDTIVTTEEARESYVLTIDPRPNVARTKTDLVVSLDAPGVQRTDRPIVRTKIDAYHRDPTTAGVVGFFVLLPFTIALDVATSPIQLPVWIYRLATTREDPQEERATVP